MGSGNIQRSIFMAVPIVTGATGTKSVSPSLLKTDFDWKRVKSKKKKRKKQRSAKEK